MNAEIAIAQKIVCQSAQNFHGSLLCHFSDSLKKNCGRIINALKKMFFVFRKLLSPN